MKIFQVSGSQIYLNWILPIGFQITSNLDDADCIFFSGGEDVDPSVYNQSVHWSTGSNISRDRKEGLIFDYAAKRGISMLGTCRGSQFICAKSGGILVQDQENTYLHKAFTYDGKEFIVNSTHHQAQYPWRMPENEFKVLAWSKNISKFHKGGNDEELINDIIPDEKECEIVFYPKNKALAFQMHNEMVFNNPDFNDLIVYSQNLIRKFILNKENI